MGTHKAVALLEVLGIFTLGNFTAGRLGPMIGIQPLGPLFGSAVKSAEPDYVPLAFAFFQNLLVQYACLLPPALAIGWLRRRLNLRHYGVTRAGQPVWALVAAGLIAFSLAAIPVKLLWVAKRFVPMGEGSPFWVLLQKSWTPSFWLLMAVSSFVLIPVLEELFYRGYCQTRLEEDFGGTGAIVIVALFLTLGHSQYHHLSFLSIGTIFALIPLMLGMGYVYWRSRSLIPSVILHAAVNVPTKGIYDFILPVAMVAVLILFRRKWLSAVRDLSAQWAVNGRKRAVFAATVTAVAAVIGFERWPAVFVPLASVGLAAALFFEFRNKSYGAVLATPADGA